ncbi:MAG: DUF5698 domain-containing protein [Dehalococcoidia bacterium]
MTMPDWSLGTALAVLAIVLLRTADVSLMAVRITFAVDGRRGIAAIVGFAEATLFAVAAVLVLSSLGDPVRIVAYGLGFAFGQYIGVSVARRLRGGMVTVRMFAPLAASPLSLVAALRSEGFRVTVFGAEGRDGPVEVLHIVTGRGDVERLMAVCSPLDDRCFVTVGDDPAAAAIHGATVSVRK